MTPVLLDHPHAAVPTLAVHEFVNAVHGERRVGRVGGQDLVGDDGVTLHASSLAPRHRSECGGLRRRGASGGAPGPSER